MQTYVDEIKKKCVTAIFPLQECVFWNSAPQEVNTLTMELPSDKV